MVVMGRSSSERQLLPSTAGALPSVPSECLPSEQGMSCQWAVEWPLSTRSIVQSSYATQSGWEDIPWPAYALARPRIASKSACCIHSSG
ncbi:hypothetical protein IscW_ISCW013382 [Ixodes scapularis]|uniref:Uncharacterized protein n=1 Tax=Ixodes scapularis TaxID=6945 RepID=B7QDQ1_IXOSC|nr:hypothetical protein IscW_ISCW013382 [Ixodes scapularis]|eukprot:XP_002413665.1 hypothetical protein IscW_ISCW013382 [Ixodes scapularis]